MIGPHVPIDRRIAIARGEALPDRCRGAALFADVSGFSSLASRLADELGPRRAAEVLLERMNRIHTLLIEPIHGFAGSVIGFAGDSITCWFDDSPLGEGEEGNGARRAVACALAMQGAMAELGTSLKIAVASGNARRFLVGDPKFLRLDTLAGETLARMARAERRALPDQIVVSEEVVDAARAAVSAWSADGAESFATVVDQRGAPRPTPWPTTEATLDDGALRGWVLSAVEERIRSAPSFADLRAVVPLFASFGGIDYDGDAAAGEQLDRLVRHVQAVLDRAGGALLELTIGDKGSYLYGVVGAPTARPDAARRAASAAFELRELPASLAVSSLAIGMSFGRAWTGVAGSAARSCYAVMGDEVNLAARLMQRAAPGEALVSAAFAAAASGVPVTPRGEITVKGRTAPVGVLALAGRPAAALADGETRGALVGRAAELEAVDGALARAREGAAAVVVIEGPAGMGKSRLADAVVQRALADGSMTAAAAGDSVERASPLYAWRGLLRDLLGLGKLEGDAAVAILERRVAEIAPELAPRLPLLGPALGLRLEETELTRWMPDDLRADNTREVAVQLVGALRGDATAPLVLVFDDAQWIDSASWALARRVVQDVPRVLLLLSARPQTEGDPEPGEDHDKLVNDPATIRIALGPLSDDDTLSLVRARLGATKLPERLARFLSSRASGRPLLAELLATSLRESGVLRIEDGRCVLSDSFDEAAVELPDTVEGVIAERLDRLPPRDLAVLGRASVLGTRFEEAALSALAPNEDPSGAVERLAERDLLTRSDGEVWFHHALVRDVTYGRLLFATRRELHRSAAEHIRKRHEDDLAPVHVALAHHYLGAEDTTNAAEQLGDAGEMALRTGAFRETTSFLERALELAGPEIGDVTRAQHKRRIASAWYRLGDLPRSTARAEEAVAVFDRDVPKAGAKLVLGVLSELAWQVAHRVSPRLAVKPAAESRWADLRSAVSLYQNLSEVYYLGGLQGPSIYAALRQVNVAERAGVSPELGEAYAVLSIISGVVGRRDLCKRYEKLAEGVIARIENPRAHAMFKHQRSLSNAAFGDFDAVVRDETDAIEVFERIGEIGRKRDALGLLGTTEYLASRYVDAERTLRALLATRTGDDRFVQEIWGSAWLGAIALVRGELPAASEHIERSISLLDRNTVGLMEVSCVGMLGLVRLHAGETAAAERHIDRAYGLIAAAKGRPTGHISLDGYAAVADAYLDWSLTASSKEGRERARKRAEQACRWLEGFAKVFAVAGPAARLMRGRAQAAAGDERAARRTFTDGIERARTLGMVCEEGRLLLAIASVEAGDARRRTAREAADKLEGIGASLYAKKAHDLA